MMKASYFQSLESVLDREEETFSIVILIEELFIFLRFAAI